MKRNVDEINRKLQFIGIKFSRTAIMVGKTAEVEIETSDVVVLPDEAIP